MHLFLFYFFSAVAILSAFCVIALPKPTRALLCLIVTMFALAILYILLGAPFVAMVHLIVYAGAVLILFLFVIMLQGVGATEIPLSKRFPAGHVLLAGLGGFLFLGLLIFLFSRFQLPPAVGVQGTIEAVGEVLFKNYLLPFELTSVLLLIGVFAAVSLAKKDEPAAKAGDNS